MATMTQRNRTKNGAHHEKLERLLSQHDSMLRNRKRTLLDNEPSEMSGVMDVEESSVDAEEQGIGFSVLGLTSRTVQELEVALRRSQTGELGVCSDCGSTISPARLRALPFALLCVACQEKNESAANPDASLPPASWKMSAEWNEPGSLEP